MLFNEDDGFGGRVIAFLDTRPNGTRSPYHIVRDALLLRSSPLTAPHSPHSPRPPRQHPYGGQTCVKSGYATPYEEGMEPMTYGPGECYWCVGLVVSSLSGEDPCTQKGGVVFITLSAAPSAPSVSAS